MKRNTTFTVPVYVPIFDRYVVFLVANNRKRVDAEREFKAAWRLHGESVKNTDKFWRAFRDSEISDSTVAAVVSQGELGPRFVVWLSEPYYHYLVHEISHLTLDILEAVGVEHLDTEVQALLSEFLFDEATKPERFRQLWRR